MLPILNRKQNSWIWGFCEITSTGKSMIDTSAFSLYFPYQIFANFPGGSVVKNLPTNAGDTDLIPGKIPWRRKWQPTLVFLPGKFHTQRSLEGYSPRGHKELDMTEWLHFHFHLLENLANVKVWLSLWTASDDSELVTFGSSFPSIFYAHSCFGLSLWGMEAFKNLTVVV